MSALLEHEYHPIAVSLYQLVLEGEESVKVPSIFLYEACNVILNATRRKRISEKTQDDYMQLIYGFPVQVDNKQSMTNVVKIASKHCLTIYDASYLELAKREAVPLATFDNALIVAAKKEKVSLLSMMTN